MDPKAGGALPLLTPYFNICSRRFLGSFWLSFWIHFACFGYLLGQFWHRIPTFLAPEYVKDQQAWSGTCRGHLKYILIYIYICIYLCIHHIYIIKAYQARYRCCFIYSSIYFYVLFSAPFFDMFFNPHPQRCLWRFLGSFQLSFWIHFACLGYNLLGLCWRR